jgi:hypothetical protein
MVSTTFQRRLKRVKTLADNYQLFFVVGAPKSGTTWLQKALDAHSEIVCAGEGHFVDKFARDLRILLDSYYKHQHVVNTNVYEGHGYYSNSAIENLEFLTTLFVLSALSDLGIPKETRSVGDKTPVSVDFLDDLHRLFPRAKVVNIVRDGRDTLVSTFKHAERVLRREQSRVDVAQFLLEKTGNYVARWVNAVERADDFASRHPDLIHTIRYEDLQEDFGAAFSGVLRFLGVDDAARQVAICQEESSFQRLSGGRQPGEEDPSAFVRKGVVGEWKACLTDQQLAIFKKTGAAWLAKWGYEAC